MVNYYFSCLVQNCDQCGEACVIQSRKTEKKEKEIMNF